MHTNNFDGIRLAAAITVLTGHQWLALNAGEVRVVGPLALGSLAVLVFFAISGYLVASSWIADPKLWRFAARRFLRIWPAYAAVVLGAALWITLTDDRPLATTAAWMFVSKHLVFERFEWNFFPTQHDPRLDPALWTIPFETGCYALFAIVACTARRWWPLVAAVAVLGSLAYWGWRWPTFDPSEVSAPTDWVLFGAIFALGACLRATPASRLPWISAAMVLLGCIAFLSGSRMLGVTVVVPALTILAGTRSWPILRDAGRFGDFSYGIYLWGWPIQQIVASRIGTQLAPWQIWMISFAAVGIAAAISWFTIERWALRAKPSSQTAWPHALTLELTR